MKSIVKYGFVTLSTLVLTLGLFAAPASADEGRHRGDRDDRRYFRRYFRDDRDDRRFYRRYFRDNDGRFYRFRDRDMRDYR